MTTQPSNWAWPCAWIQAVFAAEEARCCEMEMRFQTPNSVPGRTRKASPATMNAASRRATRRSGSGSAPRLPAIRSRSQAARQGGGSWFMVAKPGIVFLASKIAQRDAHDNDQSHKAGVRC